MAHAASGQVREHADIVRVGHAQDNVCDRFWCIWRHTGQVARLWRRDKPNRISFALQRCWPSEKAFVRQWLQPLRGGQLAEKVAVSDQVVWSLIPQSPDVSSGWMLDIQELIQGIVVVQIGLLESFKNKVQNRLK